ncbi:ADP-ribosylglycohydrolase family protein [Desulfobulbus rhabdoformis]|uniref:ADP-ribosylglycohydrolase family protein n=1 Tax=Desulfobulbus rhabdoformis TaxID=34032 RepID=UPI0019657EEE|nr:ADP-ribosylglycohydrolase family protein [Desulfobulbus rhabdoformis]MBM9613453.1 ADP-ribosylglycohydrolase family protein [Desulfobulbus rhabdoformis]
MTTPLKAMVLASFAADSLSLGAHWIYDTTEIDQKFGRIEEFIAPDENSFHRGKKRGAFTHYGDQALVLLESIAASEGFSLSAFAKTWQTMFSNYSGYRDKATKATLENMEKNLALDQCGSTSSDLGGAARIAPLVYLYQGDGERLLKAVREQTMLTHNNPATLAGAEFLAHLVRVVLGGADPAAAMEAALEEGVNDLDLDIRIRSALDSADKESRTVIKQYGQMCGIAAALPGALHLMLRYPDDLKTALVENVMAGGDSAARGLVVGMVLGARLGWEAIPQSWLTSMLAAPHIEELLTALDARA